MRHFRINHRIRAREMLVIGPDGNQIGVLPQSKAIMLAKNAGLDLVEVSPHSNPPVCKILDFGKFRYETAKKEKDSRKNTSAGKVKELKFHINIDDHDYMVKLKKAEAFMFKGMKVKIAMVFRGREMQHQNIGRDLMQKIGADLAHIGTPEANPKMLGRNLNMMLNPLPAKKRNRKFTKENEDFEDEEETAEIEPNQS